MSGFERLKAALIERLDGPRAAATAWKWAFAAMAFGEVITIPLAFMHFGFSLYGWSAALALVVYAAIALRWRDACVRAEALEQFLTVVGATRLSAEGEA